MGSYIELWGADVPSWRRGNLTILPIAIRLSLEIYKSVLDSSLMVIYIYILAENPSYGRAFQLAPAEGIYGAFGPIEF